MKRYILLTSISCLIALQAQAQHSVARKWNEVLLEAIRNDLARPTVHARNLFHVSAAMYDAWAVYDNVAESYLTGNILHGFEWPLEELSTQPDVEQAREMAISYAAYRIIRDRFFFSPGAFETLNRTDSLMAALGYDPSNTSIDYQTDGPAALGNYIAEGYLSYGEQDSSNENFNYRNEYYESINPPFKPTSPGNPNLIFPNNWQSLSLELFIDQSGNPFFGALSFLSAEWGNVSPFALQDKDLTVYERDGHEYRVYHDPGPPAYIHSDTLSPTVEEYQWGFALVSAWGAHLDPADNVIWDISPASIGNIDSFPETLEGLRDFYNLEEGGDISKGHLINPVTNEPYEPNLVPRGDYARVLAEFWADGPDSETPPGHWFTILNYVNDHPLAERKFKGEISINSVLEWDVKAYFALGGAMHDAAISAWGIKGWYDYIRPISAIRWMADQGQCSDSSLSNFSPNGIPLISGFIEIVTEDDPLAGINKQHVDKIKLYSWRGPDYIEEPETDKAGVDWILAENWWPYQRPSFVTPPFAGYVSGHSTYSRAAAEVLTKLTGDPFFPGGMGEFVAKKNEFLVFEEGPSVDVVLQWATYRDASDQTSLSRIWGGIHPPVDDIPGRIIGEQVGLDAFAFAEQFFSGTVLNNEAQLDNPQALGLVFPNPVQKGQKLKILFNRPSTQLRVQLFTLTGQRIKDKIYKAYSGGSELELFNAPSDAGFYIVQVQDERGTYQYPLIVQE